jgi:hypothetical protein
MPVMAWRSKGMAWFLSTVGIGVVACTTQSNPRSNDPPPIETDQPVPPEGIPRKYVAPRGFDGDEFGMTLAQIKARHPRLTEIGEPAAVEWQGRTRSVDLSVCLDFDKNGGCRNPVISADVESGGTVLFAEYYVAAQFSGYTEGYTFGDTGGVLAPIFIDICAQYAGHGDRVIPNTLPDDARVCAFRAFHHTYVDEYAKSETHATNDDQGGPMYQRVFFGLVNIYGYPRRYRPIGRIVIELSDGTQMTSDPTPRYVDYHWGGGSPVTVDYSFNPKDGTGAVFIADQWARDYARKRHDAGDINFLLWRLSQPGGLNHKEFESKYRNGSLAMTRFESRVEPGQLSQRVRALFAVRPHDSSSWLK